MCSTVHGESFSCLALFQSSPLELTHASVIGSPQSTARGAGATLTVGAPYNAVSAIGESKLDMAQTIKRKKNTAVMKTRGESSASFVCLTVEHHIHSGIVFVWIPRQPNSSALHSTPHDIMKV